MFSLKIGHSASVTGKLVSGMGERQKRGGIEFIVAGLGNPGIQYEQTRHNAGFLAVDYVCGQLGLSFDRRKWDSLYCEGVLADKRVLFLKPQTYMNNSGRAVTAAMSFYKIKPSGLIVISDDVNFSPGKMRVRQSGSDGGQKGLRDIIELLGSDAFPRIRIGIGAKPYPDMELADWVTSRLSADDKALMKRCFEKTKPALEFIVAGNIQAAMNLCNKNLELNA
jgi:PTH1 family peptidyl-tRNA hydrolase